MNPSPHAAALHVNVHAPVLLLPPPRSHISPRLSCTKLSPHAGTLHASVQPSSWSPFLPSSHASPGSSEPVAALLELARPVAAVAALEVAVVALLVRPLVAVAAHVELHIALHGVARPVVGPVVAVLVAAVAEHEPVAAHRRPGTAACTPRCSSCPRPASQPSSPWVEPVAAGRVRARVGARVVVARCRRRTPRSARPPRRRTTPARTRSCTRRCRSGCRRRSPRPAR
jgi:hypothetical protein